MFPSKEQVVAEHNSSTQVESSSIDNNEKKYLWKNSDNATFYEKIPINIIKQYAKARGIDNCCDLELIQKTMPGIFDQGKILEIGAGYGRVLNYLIQNNCQGKIFAVERSKKLIHYLKNKFQDKVTLYQQDLHHFATDEKFDVILWMWGSIAEFQKEEQFFILKNLKNHLNKNGTIILDTMSHILVLENATQPRDQYCHTKTSDCTVHFYLTSEKQIFDYGENLRLKKAKVVHYFSKSGRERMLHIFKN
jgi:SAM-dependent methyltransferase